MLSPLVACLPVACQALADQAVVARRSLTRHRFPVCQVAGHHEADSPLRDRLLDHRPIVRPPVQLVTAARVPSAVSCPARPQEVLAAVLVAAGMGVVLAPMVLAVPVEVAWFRLEQ